MIYVIRLNQKKYFNMTDNSSASNFDNYIAELHENIDRLRDINDVDEQSSAIVADLAQAYSEHPSPMQTGDQYKFLKKTINKNKIMKFFSILSDVSIVIIFWTEEYSYISSTGLFKD